MKELRIKKVFNTVDELNNSEEFKEMWDGFQMRKEREYPDLKMLKAFVLEDGRIFALRESFLKNEKGLRILGEVTVNAMLTNSPFMIGTTLGDRVICINEEHRYSRCKENRTLFAKRCQETDYIFVTTAY